MVEADVTQVHPQLHPPLHDPHVTGRGILPIHVPNSRKYGTIHHLPTKVNVMLGKIITVHQDGVQNVTLLYRPEVTEELTLSVSWLREHVTVDFTADEMDLFIKSLTKAVKKVRKHKRKLDKDTFVSLDSVSDYIQRGRRK